MTDRDYMLLTALTIGALVYGLGAATGNRLLALLGPLFTLSMTLVAAVALHLAPDDGQPRPFL